MKTQPINLVMDYHKPHRFYLLPTAEPTILYLLEDRQNIVKRSELLSLDVLTVDQLETRDGSCGGYIVAPMHLKFKVRSNHVYIGSPSDPDRYTFHMGLPGMQIYLGISDAILVSLMVTPYYELIEQTGELGYESK